MVRQWIDFMRRPDIAGHVLFIEDYDMVIASELVQGVDLWISTPLRPWEACGTSGMKVLVNGGLNLSELEGWWGEAYAPEFGWAIGDGKEHNADPVHDAAEADALYECLEREAIPAFYTRDERGVPVEWVARMRESMSKLTTRFSSNRMVREYTEHCYLRGANSYRHRIEQDGKPAAELEAWSRMLLLHWPGLRFGNLYVDEDSNEASFRVQLYLGYLDRNAVRVELYADAREGRPPERVAMSPLEPIPGAVNGFTYGARVARARRVDDYTPRVVAHHPDALVPLEASNILWYR
jgi:starch phosphorylase